MTVVLNILLDVMTIKAEMLKKRSIKGVKMFPFLLASIAQEIPCYFLI